MKPQPKTKPIRLKRGSKAYKDLQLAVLKRDKHTCQKCGIFTKNAPHHIVYLSQGGSDTMDNMITLCGPLEDDCHRKEHNKEELKAFIEWADKNNLPTARDHGIFWWRKTQEAWERWVKGNDTNVKK